MLSVRVVLPLKDTHKPPVLLVHGAANSNLMWSFWQDELAEHGYPAYAVDLRGHGASVPYDLSGTSMQDYADDVRSLAAQLRTPPILLGWSMGGLVALMAAGHVGTPAWIGLEPSVPGEAKGPSPTNSGGVFGPEEYGITSADPEDQPAMHDLRVGERRIALESLGLESRFARDERQAGIWVDEPGCPLLIASGSANHTHANYGKFPFDHTLVVEEGLSHWGLVLNRAAVSRLASRVTGWLSQQGL